MSISIIVPVHNEEDCIARCLEETRRAFDDLDHEVIVVDDGSTDRSHALIEALAAGDGRIRCISYPVNRGYSHALRQGIQVARKDYTVFLDADLQYPPHEVRVMFDAAAREGRVFLLGAPTRKYYDVYRRMLSAVYNRLVTALLDLPVGDANSVKVIRTDVLKTLRLEGELGRSTSRCSSGSPIAACRSCGGRSTSSAGSRDGRSRVWG
jgi:glycosyltransferase involved in cell wall biosynthesis